jgi:hypothetical protein
MEGHAHRRLQVTALVVALALPLLTPLVARAEEDPIKPPVDIWVDTDDEGVNVDAGTGTTEPGGGGSGGGGGGSAPRCHLEELSPDEWDQSIELEYWARRMHYAPYNLICNGEWEGVVWIEIVLDEDGDPLPPPSSPREVAERLRDRLPVPRVSVEINPDRGVVGVESWFWLDGYDGSTLRHSTDAFGWLVEVEARVTHYEWSFGDGAVITSESPGNEYPQRSSVRHVYERSSLGLHEGYSVEASFVFAVRYRVDGGSWTSLPGITRASQANYPVRESQAVIQR